jgi:ubiquinone/menaquinone biosynthesis C-methylase UbiE
MKRVPEPELMLDDEQARAYAQADFEEPHARFVELLKECFPTLSQTGTALDLGCGPADVTIRFARAFPCWSVDGVDGSPAMLRYGAEAVERAGLQERISLTLARLPDGELPRKHYDLVFSNSLLHRVRHGSHAPAEP